MRRLDRLWIQAIEKCKDRSLLKLLTLLRVVNMDTRSDFMDVAHEKVRECRYKLERNQLRMEARDFSIPIKAPKSIKPTKSRKF